MPLVTALEPLKGRLGGFLLEAEEAAPFRVPEHLCQSHGLRVGARLTPAELAALREEAGSAEAMDRAVHYLSYRPRTCREVRDYLRRHGLSRFADGALDRCLEVGYLNDEAYALSFVRERVRLKPRGRPRLVSELRARGIDAETADRAVDTVLGDEGVSERDLLREVAASRAASLRNVPVDRARRRLASFLERRGFRSADIREVVSEFLPDRPEAE